MRTRLLSLLMLLTVTIISAQSSANVAGIAIQGIARDNNNTARASATISLTFRIYYGSNIQIYEVTKSVTTDSFGVFSAVLEPGASNNVLIANNQAYLKISEGTTIISDEILKQVPYAIAATNGVPTGSIMPFIGTAAPAGWALCNGTALPTDGSAAALIALVGNNAPNLQGMFLRGTGTSPVNSQSGPALKATQQDELKGHTHTSGTLVNNNAGKHNHGSIINQTNLLVNKDGTTTAGTLDNSANEINLINATQIPEDGEHTHTISGSTATTGGSETRPVNYGVNYIIKL